MADRYWVGGTGNWSDTNKWSATSGGTGGASVPTQSDSVFFNSASNATAYTVTVDVSSNCLDLNVAGPASGQVTFAGTATLNVSGSMALTGGTAGINWTYTGLMILFGGGVARTINTNGVTLTNGISFNSTGQYTLTSALTITGGTGVNCNFTTGGSFNTGASSFAVTAPYFFINTTVSNVNLNSSTITCTGGFGWSCIAGATLSASSSTIVINGVSSYSQDQFQGGNQTYGSVTLSYTAGNFNFVVSGNNTFAGTFSVTGPSAVGYKNILFRNNQIFSGAFNTSSTAGPNRVVFQSDFNGRPVFLTMNGTTSLTDADFQDVYVSGTAAPISGTRIGDRRGNRGITFSAPKTVYWNLAAGGNWNANAWAATSGGAVATTNFPLPQDQAIIQNTGLNTSATITINASHHIGSIDAGARTNAMTLSVSTTCFVYGNFKYTQTASGVDVVMCGRRPQTLTCSGTSSLDFTVDSPGGIVKLDGALNCDTLSFKRGALDTNSFSVSPAFIRSELQDTFKLFLRNSTISLVTSTSTATTTWILFDNVKRTSNFTLSTLVMDPGTSTLNIPSYTGAGNIAKFNFGASTWNNVNFNGTDLNEVWILDNSNTFNNITFSGPASAGVKQYIINGDNMIVNGTFTAVGGSAIRRIMFRSVTPNLTRTITANTVSLSDVDFQNITASGAATWTGTRLGDCNGNSGITFPAPKLVYWNLTGTQDISATAWATTSGGTPALNNFPLAQDTMFFDNTGAATTIAFGTGPWNFGTFNTSERTSAVTFSVTVATPSVSPNFYGDFMLGTGVTWTSTAGGINLASRSTSSVIMSNGRTINTGITLTCRGGKYTLVGALNCTSLTFNDGFFDAAEFNVTTGFVLINGGTAWGTTPVFHGVYMGSGTWTLTGTGSVWSRGAFSDTSKNWDFDKGTANLIISDASTATKSFSSGSGFNKITLTGNATCTYDFLNSNLFTEIASTKTVAFTITLSTTAVQFFHVWNVSGTAGNLVTVTTRTASTQCWLGIGSTTSGVDYLNVSWVNMYNAGVSGYAQPMNYGQFFAGANSTNGGNNTEVYFTATPAARTLYWVGGTGNWSDANKWSTSSGGGGGAGPPNMIDDVVFNSASNGTAYTVTVDTDYARCNNFTMDGPASGAVTWAGTAILRIAGNFSLTGGTAKITNSYTGPILFVGSGAHTVNYNGITTTSVVFNAGQIVNATDATWTLTSAMTLSSASFLQIFCGKLDTAGFAVSTGYLRNETTFNLDAASLCKPCTLALGASTISLTNTTNTNAEPILNFGSSSWAPSKKYFTLEAGTSTISYTGGTYANKFYFSGLTFYNVNFINQGIFSSYHNLYFDGTTATFNNLTLEGTSGVGSYRYNFSPTATSGPPVEDPTPNITVTVNGTFTVRGKVDWGNYRVRLFSGDNVDMSFYQRRYNVTLNAATATLRDADFCGFTLGGTASWSGTRIGNLGGNQGLTASTPKTVYAGSTATSTWDYAFATSSGGAGNANNYPLAQDTVIIDNNSNLTANTLSIFDSLCSVGTFDSSSRTAPFTVNCSSVGLYLHGSDFKAGTGVTFTASSTNSFLRLLSGTTNQTITTNGVSLANLNIWICPLASNGYGYSVILNGALTARSISHVYGALDSNSFNITTGFYNASYVGGFGGIQRVNTAITSTQYVQLILKNTNVTLTSNSGTGYPWQSQDYNANTGSGNYGYTDVANATLTIANPTNSANLLIATGNLKIGKLSLAGTGTNQTFTLDSHQTYGEVTSSRTSAYILNINNKSLEVDKFTATGISGGNLTIRATYTVNQGPGILRKIGPPVKNIDYITIDGVSLDGDTQKTWYLGGNSGITTGTWGGGNVSSAGEFSRFSTPKQGSMGAFFQ